MSVVYEKQLRRGRRRRALIKRVLATLQSLSVGCSMVYYYFMSASSSTSIWLIIRSILAVTSLMFYLLWALARYQLGASLAFTVTTDGPFIATGLYAKFRNPIYLFGTFALMTYLLAICRPRWLLILLVIVPMQYVRAARESKALKKRYDEQYDAYLKQVWL
jgi:protein-S-isoprenylcysteine O-methyltransferase Ste14